MNRCGNPRDEAVKAVEVITEMCLESREPPGADKELQHDWSTSAHNNQGVPSVAGGMNGAVGNVGSYNQCLFSPVPAHRRMFLAVCRPRHSPHCLPHNFVENLAGMEPRGLPAGRPRSAAALAPHCCRTGNINNKTAAGQGGRPANCTIQWSSGLIGVE